MSDIEFFHRALVRRIRDRDDCDDDLRGACDEIDDCHDAIRRLESEIARLRLTDAEREAVETAILTITQAASEVRDDKIACETLGRLWRSLRGLLERTG